MDNHIKNTVKCCHFHLRNIGKIRRFLTQDSTTKLVHAFISSRLDYNNALLYGLPKSQINKLQRIQNTAARIVTSATKSEHITPYLKELHWLPVEYRIQFKINTLTYRCLNNLAPQYLCDLLQKYQPPKRLRSSSVTQLVVPKTRLSGYGDRAFSKASPTLWNSLPASVQQQKTLASFRVGLKTHLYRKAFSD